MGGAIFIHDINSTLLNGCSSPVFVTTRPLPHPSRGIIYIFWCFSYFGGKKKINFHNQIDDKFTHVLFSDWRYRKMRTLPWRRRCRALWKLKKKICSSTKRSWTRLKLSSCKDSDSSEPNDFLLSLLRPTANPATLASLKPTPSNTRHWQPPTHLFL